MNPTDVRAQPWPVGEGTWAGEGLDGVGVPPQAAATASPATSEYPRSRIIMMDRPDQYG